tara:strand:+ start:82175 stop:82513 length:339 start_codon:yes stop_codon:yes gene_type:complete
MKLKDYDFIMEVCEENRKLMYVKESKIQEFRNVCEAMFGTEYTKIVYGERTESLVWWEEKGDMSSIPGFKSFIVSGEIKAMLPVLGNVLEVEDVGMWSSFYGKVMSKFSEGE